MEEEGDDCGIRVPHKRKSFFPGRSGWVRAGAIAYIPLGGLLGRIGEAAIVLVLPLLLLLRHGA